MALQIRNSRPNQPLDKQMQFSCALALYAIVPAHQAKRKNKHRSLLQQVGPLHGTYDTTVRQALSSKLKTHP
eukprot:1155150-Pelagomonas_calceolata.AAC.1